MIRRLVFEVEVESDQEAPELGVRGDWISDGWEFLDVELVEIRDTDDEEDS